MSEDEDAYGHEGGEGEEGEEEEEKVEDPVIEDEQNLQEKVEERAGNKKESKLQQPTNPPVKEGEPAAPILPAKTSPSETPPVEGSAALAPADTISPTSEAERNWFAIRTPTSMFVWQRIYMCAMMKKKVLLIKGWGCQV